MRTVPNAAVKAELDDFADDYEIIEDTRAPNMKYDHGVDPMIHHKRAHFMYDDTNHVVDDEKFKIFIFMKFIGEGHLDASILQLGYLHERDSRPEFTAVEPNEKLSKRLIDQLKYSKSSRSGTWTYDKQECVSMRKALERLLDYTKEEMKKERKREAILVAFHSDHVLALVNQILIAKMSTEFLGVFRGYTILEEDVRRFKRIPNNPHLTLDDAYYEVFKKDPSETSSESDNKAKKLRKVFDKIVDGLRLKPRMHPLDSNTFSDARNKFFKALEDLTDLVDYLRENLAKAGLTKHCKKYPLDKLFNPFPNHFHKSKNAEYENVEKRVAWKFCEILVASALDFPSMLDKGARLGWNKCFPEFKVSFLSKYFELIFILSFLIFREKLRIILNTKPSGMTASS